MDTMAAIGICRASRGVAEWRRITDYNTRLEKSASKLPIAVRIVRAASTCINRITILADVSIGMFRPIVEYKSKIYDNQITVANRWYPSSKTCSVCGAVNDLKQGDKVFKCPTCGAVIDRDENAAINLKNLIPTACGEFMSVDSERLPKARREAETTTLASRQQLLF